MPNLNNTHKFFPLLLLAASSANASLIGVEQATEMMMDLQGSDGAFLGRAFGGDAGSPINFNSSMNAGGTSFQYSTAAGSMYKGSALAISGGNRHPAFPADSTGIFRLTKRTA